MAITKSIRHFSFGKQSAQFLFCDMSNDGDMWIACACWTVFYQRPQTRLAIPCLAHNDRERVGLAYHYLKHIREFGLGNEQPFIRNSLVNGYELVRFGFLILNKLCDWIANRPNQTFTTG